MRQNRPDHSRTLALWLGVLAILANVLAPAALAGVGARANAAMFAGPFNAPICHGGAVSDAPSEIDTTPGLHCPLCPAPAATALAASAIAPKAITLRWLANPVAAHEEHASGFAPPSEHRPRGPPNLS
jgi:hypothetical protein